MDYQTKKRGMELKAEGKLDCRGNRFGFLVQEDGDVFIPPNKLNGARHGDTVKVSYRKNGDSYDGRVDEILEKNNSNVVATVLFQDNRFFARPDDKHYGELLPLTELSGASNNDKVVIEIVTGEVDRARVVTRIGRKDEPGVDVLSVIYSHNLKTEFDPETLAQADALPDEIDAADIGGRRDFRGDIIFTIDGEDSKDFDDAVSLVKTASGYKLGVYIADVAQYVTAGSALDNEAFTRGTSVYLADRVIPMLPEKLSNGLCSLNEKRDRFVLCALMDVNEQGEVVGHEICEGVINSVARLTYKGVQAVLDGDEELSERYSELKPMFLLMEELANKRLQLKKERGAIDFDFTESEIVYDENGHVVDLKKRERLLTHKLIEEFMIMANETVAKEFALRGLPFVFRSHDKPKEEKIEALNDFLKTAGLNFRCPSSPEPRDIANALKRVPSTLKSPVSYVALRSMAKAIYEPTNHGHFGLALKYYCHFTSPIRRYPDLMIHRIIKAFLHGGEKSAIKFNDTVKVASKQSSACEKVAADAERKSDDYKKAEYMSHHIGEVFEGMISSVLEFGFFVELDNSAEGLVHVSVFPRPMVFDYKSLSLTGCGRTFRLGDRVKVRVRSVTADKVDFELDEPVEADVDDSNIDTFSRVVHQYGRSGTLDTSGGGNRRNGRGNSQGRGNNQGRGNSRGQGNRNHGNKNKKRK